MSPPPAANAFKEEERPGSVPSNITSFVVPVEQPTTTESPAAEPATVHTTTTTVASDPPAPPLSLSHRPRAPSLLPAQPPLPPLAPHPPSTSSTTSTLPSPRNKDFQLILINGRATLQHRAEASPEVEIPEVSVDWGSPGPQQPEEEDQQEEEVDEERQLLKSWTTGIASPSPVRKKRRVSVSDASGALEGSTIVPSEAEREKRVGGSPLSNVRGTAREDRMQEDGEDEISHHNQTIEEASAIARRLFHPSPTSTPAVVVPRRRPSQPRLGFAPPAPPRRNITPPQPPSLPHRSVSAPILPPIELAPPTTTTSSIPPSTKDLTVGPLVYPPLPSHYPSTTKPSSSIATHLTNLLTNYHLMPNGWLPVLEELVAEGRDQLEGTRRGASGIAEGLERGRRVNKMGFLEGGTSGSGSGSGAMEVVSAGQRGVSASAEVGKKREKREGSKEKDKEKDKEKEEEEGASAAGAGTKKRRK